MCHVSLVLCHLSPVTCQISHVMCHMSHIMCHMSSFFSFFFLSSYLYILKFKHIFLLLHNMLELVGGGSVINRAYPSSLYSVLRHHDIFNDNNVNRVIQIARTVLYHI